MELTFSDAAIGRESHKQVLGLLLHHRVVVTVIGSSIELVGPIAATTKECLLLGGPHGTQRKIDWEDILEVMYL